MLVSLKPLRTHGQVKIILNASIKLQKPKAYKHNYEACVYVAWGGEKKSLLCFQVIRHSQTSSGGYVSLPTLYL